MRQLPILLFVLLGASTAVSSAPIDVDADTDMWRRARSNFVNWENPHVHPLDITPDQSTLVAVNTPDNSLMVFNINGGQLQLSATIPVGIDPVSVRARTNNEIWVVNHVSDSVSVVDLNEGRVTAVLQTEDEPADVVFAGTPQRAFVSISQKNRINVFNVFNLNEPAESVFINGEDPRAMAVSPDGNTVYLAVFESGNGSISISGGKAASCCQVDIVGDSRGPYGGIAIPPNDGENYNPPINPDITLPPGASMIVKKDENNRWMDDNGGDWTRFVSGDLVDVRVRGWDLPDRDVAIIDANSLSIDYQAGLLNANMAIAVNPASGDVTVVGTDATNEIRWEPNLKSTFVRVKMAKFTPGGQKVISDLNTHLTYNTRSISQAQRNQSIGDPRGIAWSSNGEEGYITGMGSNNVIIIDDAGQRLGRVEVGQGPTGIVLTDDDTTAFVLNKFDASISVLNLNSAAETSRVSFYDPTPDVIKAGRALLYDTHATSGLGQASCASCHLDARTDRLAWDLGNPSGEMEKLVGTNLTNSPIKGPLLTMTLQDAVGHKMMHWAGDRTNLSSFDHAFVNLQGADSVPSSNEMLEFEAFLASIAIPPNPNRNLDNSYSTNFSVPGPNNTIARTGNAVAGAAGFETRCRRCHAGDTARGSVAQTTTTTTQYVRPPTWRNFHERTGLWHESVDGSNSGFGFLPDGTHDSTHNNSRPDDFMALMHSINGRFPYTPSGLDEETYSHDTHAAVGRQVILGGEGAGSSSSLVDTLLSLADRGEIDVVVQRHSGSQEIGYTYMGGDRFQSDRKVLTISEAELRATIESGDTLIFTAVPAGSGTRIGIDRDMDGAFNGDESDQNTDPSDPSSFPGSSQCTVLENAALNSSTSQSTSWSNGLYKSDLAVDGDKSTFTHTVAGQSPASWSVELDDYYDIESIILYNRDNCCKARLRDLTVYIYDESGDHVAYRSQFMNRHNQMNGPSSIVLDLVGMTGSSVKGKKVKVVRTPDTFSSGLNGGSANGSNDMVLSLGEVEVLGCKSPEKVVTVYNGNFAGASQVLAAGRYNINRLSFGNDRISSVSVPAGWTVTLYKHASFRGGAYTLTEDTSLVGNAFDNQASSVVVTAPRN